jgi:hypothetical protein
MWCLVAIFSPTSEIQWGKLGFRKGTKGPGGNVVRLEMVVVYSIILCRCVVSDNFGGKSNLLVNKSIAPTIIRGVDDERSISEETRADLFVEGNVCLEMSLKVWVVNHGIVVHCPSFKDFPLCSL